MSAITESLRRAIVPGLMVRLFRWRTPSRLSASLRRAFGGRARMELFFAYDDPYSAIALGGLMKLAAKHGADLHLYPLREHGIEGDPAADKRRVHAIEDCRRLAQRSGRELVRTSPLTPQDCAFLAEWTEAARGGPGMAAFAAAALDQLWFASSEAVLRESFRALRQQHLAGISDADSAAALDHNRQRMLRLGHWESPSVRVEGEWFFAHERLEQIEEHLLDLGW